MATYDDAIIKGPYNQTSVKRRIEAFLLDNVGRVATREQIMTVAQNPQTGAIPENWHQRLSELRTDDGYTILSWRNRGDLRVSEYVLASAEKRPRSGRRITISTNAWKKVLERAALTCEWVESGEACGLKQGDIDPIGGGTVRLTPDHIVPHSVNPAIHPDNPDEWQALCGRHQVMKKNYWDPSTGWLNVLAIVQSAPEDQKRLVLEFLKEYFGED